MVPGGANTGRAIVWVGSGFRKEIGWDQQGGVASEGHVLSGPSDS